MGIVSKHKAINRMEHTQVEQGSGEMIKKRYAYEQRMKNYPKRDPTEDKSKRQIKQMVQGGLKYSFVLLTPFMVVET